MIPFGHPVRFHLDLTSKTSPGEMAVWVESDAWFDQTADSEFPCFEQGGIEFPVINYYRHDAVF